LALLPPLSARVSLPRLALARSATLSRSCYRRLGLQFTVGENHSAGYGRFLLLLHHLYRLPSQTHTWSPMVFTVIGSTPSLPLQGLILLLGYSYSLLTRLAPYCRRRPSDCHGRAPRLCLLVVLHCLSGGCHQLGFSTNGSSATMVSVAPAPSLFFFHCRLLRVLINGS